MPKYRKQLPFSEKEIFACYTGMDTELLYVHGMDLPGFASYPLLDDPVKRALIKKYYSNLVDLAREQGTGVILDAVSWVANRDRGAELGITPDALRRYNIEAIELIATVRKESGDLPTILCAQVGPRDDGYAPSEQMSVTEAYHYHSEQIDTYSSTEADLICASTLCYSEEASGIVKAAKKYQMPVAISFTVETDGNLPTGQPLADAIRQVDAETDNYASYFLINCAHPEHFSHVLTDDGAWKQRLRGVIVNASRCSHAELEVAEALDSGNPEELGKQVGELRSTNPHFNIVGGCCGSNLSHMKHILENMNGV